MKSLQHLRRVLPATLAVILFVGLFLLNAGQEDGLPTGIDDSIQSALSFLEKAQGEDGEFPMYGCTQSHDSSCQQEKSPFISSFVEYSLASLDYPEVTAMRDKTHTYFLQQQELQNKDPVWRFWSKDSPKYEELPPDLDVTTCVAASLLRAGKIKSESGLPNWFFAARNEQGLFYTYLVDDAKKRELIAYNDVDCVVNANILFYAALQGKQYKPICEYLRKYIRSDKTGCSLYYPDGDMALYYAVSRAYIEGAVCIKDVKGDIVAKVLKAYEGSGRGWAGNLNNALAAVTLLNFDYRGEEIRQAISLIQDNQEEAGNWTSETFFVDPIQHQRYKSDALVTALSLEAFAKYEKNATFNY